jgi:hypothetical protein
MPVLLQVVHDNADSALIEQLEKIYQDIQPERLTLPEHSEPLTVSQFIEAVLSDDTRSFYCALFNERLIGAMVIENRTSAWSMSHFCVRKVTRRRRVGSHLLLLTLKAADIQEQPLQVDTASLMTPDYLILQRMGYQLTEQGEHYQITHSA